MSRIETHDNMQGTKKRHSKSSGRNPLQLGMLAFFQQRRTPAYQHLPKRYTIYPPLLVLPTNFVSYTPEWKNLFSTLTSAEKNDLFACIATAFAPHAITHIAINGPISLETDDSGKKNMMRSPSHLSPVYGDFGPSVLEQPYQNSGQPTDHDFQRAFWVSTLQNGAVYQTWAPLWTMFSRGNIKEKARILDPSAGMKGLTMEDLGRDSLNGHRETLSGVDVADLYVGIGYFAFSYLKRGVRTVFGWEINGWSVEGLRRGCEMNG